MNVLHLERVDKTTAELWSCPSAPTDAAQPLLRLGHDASSGTLAQATGERIAPPLRSQPQPDCHGLIVAGLSGRTAMSLAAGCSL
jgi:hypothetical protein